MALASSPACANDANITRDFWHDARPVARGVLEHLRASGLPQHIRAPRSDIAVILWDEPKTPRPGGSKGVNADGISIRAASIIDTRQR
ncbi:MAG: hypothetical protein KIT18_10885 [Burkholderiales bacterium]|nr:hypothetical protein [Burkholderiales bacterium]